jgi:carbonic anhydrase/acetyltransferase-like protein (isoleucine patch superfamily)
MPVIQLGSKPPIVQCTYIASGAMVVGDVVLRPGSSVWFNAVLRGDQQTIDIGVDVNVQDLALLHAEHHPTVIGRGSSIGHGAIVHGATVGENTLIGMGAILNEGVRVGHNCLIASGTVVPPGACIPDNSLVMGSPGKVVRQVRDPETQTILENTLKYKAKAEKYLRTAVVHEELAWAA